MILRSMKLVRLFAACAALGAAAGCQSPGFDDPILDAGGPHPPDLPSPHPLDLSFPFKPDAGLQPEFGPTVQQVQPPPPISGGTLLARKDGKVVAADPDRDRVYLVDPGSKGGVLATIKLNDGDEPGRAVEDGSGRVHVVLRRGGAVVDLDAAGMVLDRRAVCPLPRGIDYDVAKDSLWVACAGGELVVLPAAGGAPSATYHRDRDLRDVVVQGADVYVSRFRGAEILLVDEGTGVLKQRTSLPPVVMFDKSVMEAAVAWRMIPWPSGGVLVVHQRASAGVVVPMPGGYGGQGNMGGCGNGSVGMAVTRVAAGEEVPATAVLPLFTLPVDVAVDRNGTSITVAAPGEYKLVRSQIAQLDGMVASTSSVCAGFQFGGMVRGQVTAVTTLPTGELAFQTREPATIVTSGRVTELANDSREDTGHAIFHSDSGAGIACASCHPEGGEDGRAWNFAKIGPRRTQSVRGGVLGTAPFHWDGDQVDLSALMNEVFSFRMGGPFLTQDRMDALGHFVGAIPAFPGVAADAQSIARGKALFEDVQVGCTSCHTGALLTNNQTLDVGTGKAFQVPSLRGLAWRAPYMHDGCARTLAERFGACGGGDRHGNTSRLSQAQIADLVAYLETL